MPVISLSLNDQLLEDIDKLQTELGYSGRSEVMRAAIRLFLTDGREKQRLEGNVSGLLLAIHSHEAEHHVTQIKGKYQDIIHTQLHNRFREGKCMELFILEGDAIRIRELSTELQRNEENEYVKLLII
ncbi:nickel-responsive regulator 1 [Candidatus Bathyarchaeota archaeon RBG_13_52_12]|nr:MAG: nickel-responsive regulator 1 [Candidatus Bathyarchaeota archaeon RBG_13_52_12]